MHRKLVSLKVVGLRENTYPNDVIIAQNILGMQILKLPVSPWHIFFFLNMLKTEKCSSLVGTGLISDND